MKITKSLNIIIGVGLITTLIGGGLWGMSKQVFPKLITSSQRVGGAGHDSIEPAVHYDSVKYISELYDSGKYKDAEAFARQMIDANASASDPVMQKDVVEARHLLALSALGMKDFRLARDRFAVLRVEASKLSDQGNPEQTLMEEGAYRHAVCTDALRERNAAEAEYIQFMHDFPESSFRYAVIMRIQHLHHGHFSKAAESAWDEAKGVAKSRMLEREKNSGKYAPECLAELLRRNGEGSDVYLIAGDMNTSDDVTSMQSLADCATAYGFTTRVLPVNEKDLANQPFPLISMIKGRYVIVENVGILGVNTWDPRGKGIGHPANVHYSTKEWSKLWRGVALLIKSDS